MRQARKALRSPKGMMRPQAIGRGQAVRSQVEMQERGKHTADEAKKSPEQKGKFDEKQTKVSTSY